MYIMKKGLLLLKKNVFFGIMRRKEKKLVCEYYKIIENKK